VCGSETIKTFLQLVQKTQAQLALSCIWKAEHAT